MADDILFHTVSDSHNQQLAIVTLNRPKALNAMSADMFLQLREQLLGWEENPSIKAVLVKSAVEKAFCAGGDIRAIYENKHISIDEMAVYFQREYDVNKIIHHYKKPYIALTHGITMGGGVGISIHASHRIAAEDLRWAMPETLIGFFPDVGATYYLSRLENEIGTYLALTGNTITADMAYALKLVDHIVPKTEFAALEEALINTPFESTDHMSISRIISEFSKENEAHAFKNLNEIKKYCSLDTIEEIFDALQRSDSLFGMDMLVQLEKCSPTSLKVTLEQLRRAKKMNVDAVLAMDFVISKEMLRNHDFYEGVRAAVIDKDKMPQWDPDKVSDVVSVMVAKYF